MRHDYCPIGGQPCQSMRVEPCSTKKPILALQPMLDALHIKQRVSFDECSALFGELFEATRLNPKASELSGNEWCALVNLALARFVHKE